MHASGSWPLQVHTCLAESQSTWVLPCMLSLSPPVANSQRRDGAESSPREHVPPCPPDPVHVLPLVSLLSHLQSAAGWGRVQSKASIYERLPFLKGWAK